MFKARFLVAPLVVLIIFGLIVLGGLAVYRVGWSEGYRMAQLVVGGEEGGVAPYAPYRFGFPGLFLTLGLILLLFVVVGKFLRFWAWRAAWGAGMTPPPGAGGWSTRRHWARRWYHHYPPMPPWCWDWEEGAEEPTPGAEPGAGTADAQAEI